eukprot:13648765-Alexandrium_andersonii.AAC.1
MTTIVSFASGAREANYCDSLGKAGRRYKRRGQSFAVDAHEPSLDVVRMRWRAHVRASREVLDDV